MQKKDRMVLSKLGPSDVLGGSISILGIGWSIYNGYKTGISWDIGFCFVSQAIVLIAWIYIIWYRYKGFSLIEQYVAKHKEAESKIDEEHELAVAEIEKRVQEHKNTSKQVAVISSAVKSNSIHLNEMLRKAPEKNEEQYSTIELTQQLDLDNPHNIIIAQERIQEASEHYADSLFEIFNHYFRLATEDIKRSQEALLRIYGYTANVSVTVKLLNDMYYTEIDSSDNFDLYTAFRDSTTYREKEREVGERIYKIGKNTGYVQCLRKEHHILNNIKRNNGSYMNENERFDEFYNCTVTVPIKIKQTEVNQVFYGFLCCECKNEGEVFDSVNAHLLYGFAQNMATFLETLDVNWIDRYLGDEESSIEGSILEVLKRRIMKKH